MENKNQPIYPVMMQQVGDESFRMARPNDPKEHNIPCVGLTKREWFAGQALQGLLANYHVGGHGRPLEDIANMACDMADAVLISLA